MIYGGEYAYQMSPKIPYTYTIPGTQIYINFTLGNYIKIATNGTIYEGELTDNYIEESEIKLWEYAEAYGLGIRKYDNAENPGEVTGFTAFKRKFK